MEYEYLQYPRSVHALADEIIRVTNDYNARKVSNEEFTAIIHWYATKFPEKLFKGTDYNPTVKKVIGVRRIRILDKVLEGLQLQIYTGLK